MSVPEKLPIREDLTGRRWTLELHLPDCFNKIDTEEEIYRRYNAYLNQQMKIEELGTALMQAGALAGELSKAYSKIADQQTKLEKIRIKAEYWKNHKSDDVFADKLFTVFGEEIFAVLNEVNKTIMKKFYFTFGLGQLHENCYTIIEAENWETARRQMFQKFGSKWSMQYESAEEADVEKFHLREIK